MAGTGQRHTSKDVGARCNVPLRILFFLAIFFPLACATPQEVRSVRSWDPTTHVEHAVALTEDLLVVRRTPVRTEIDRIAPGGALKERLFADRPVTLLTARGEAFAWIEEIGPGVAIVRRPASTAAPGVATISNEANWTDLVLTRDGEAIGFESLFLSRLVRPSAVRIRNFDRELLLLSDQFSYHAPIPPSERFVLSPIDRRIRRLRAAGVIEIGEVTSFDAPPLASADGERIVWFGPHHSGSALYLAEGDAMPRILRSPLGMTPHAWIGADLLLAERNELTNRWTLSIVSVADGLVKRIVPVPAHVTPRTILASPDGRHIGLPLNNGSLLLRIEDGFLQEFRDLPLSMWRFSGDGKTLYLISQRDLRVVNLQ
jgi:hypothetical protein